MSENTLVLLHTGVVVWLVFGCSVYSSVHPLMTLLLVYTLYGTSTWCLFQFSPPCFVVASFTSLMTSNTPASESLSHSHLPVLERRFSWELTLLSAQGGGPGLWQAPCRGFASVRAAPNTSPRVQPSFYVVNSENCSTEQFVHSTNSTRKRQMSCPFVACNHPN